MLHRCALGSVTNVQGLLRSLLASIVEFAQIYICGPSTVLQGLLENGLTLLFQKAVPSKLLLPTFVFVVKHMTYVLNSSHGQSL